MGAIQFGALGNEDLLNLAKVWAIVLTLIVGGPTWALDVANGQTESSKDTSRPEKSEDDADFTGKGWSRFYAIAGFTHLDAGGTFRIKLPDGRQFTVLNFDIAGLENKDYSHWLSLNWRARNSRWGAWFATWRFDSVGSRVWDRDLDLGEGVIFPAGASVTSDFEASWYILEATYSLYRTEKIDAGVGFGVHTVSLDTQLAARANVGNNEFELVSRKLDTLAPLPNVLVFTAWKFAPRWRLIARLGYFSLDYKEYSGSMVNAHTMVNFDFTQRWSLGLGYQFVELDLDVDKADHKQIYDIDIAGPIAYLRVDF